MGVLDSGLSYGALAIAWSWLSSHPGPRDPWLEHPPKQVQRAEGMGPLKGGAFEFGCLMQNALREV